MIRLSGLTVRDGDHPDGDIEIELTGLRPGEKLYEELLIGDNPGPTTHPKILRASEHFLPWGELEPELRVLKQLVDNDDVESGLEMLRRLVVEFKPEGRLVDWVHQEQSARSE
jgi:FlaA1/EpsC-like NDP-sugar epimerase